MSDDNVPFEVIVPAVTDYFRSLPEVIEVEIEGHEIRVESETDEGRVARTYPLCRRTSSFNAGAKMFAHRFERLIHDGYSLVFASSGHIAVPTWKRDDLVEEL